jgi:hypothetical protein
MAPARRIADVQIPDHVRWLDVLNPPPNGDVAGAAAMLTKRGYVQALRDLGIAGVDSLSEGALAEDTANRFSQSIKQIQWRWPSFGKAQRRAIKAVAAQQHREVAAARQTWQIAWLARTAARGGGSAQWAHLQPLCAKAFAACPRLFAADLAAAELIMKYHTKEAEHAQESPQGSP